MPNRNGCQVTLMLKATIAKVQNQYTGETTVLSPAQYSFRLFHFSPPPPLPPFRKPRHCNLEIAALKANLIAKTKLIAEQGKDSWLTKLRMENKQIQNEQNLQTAKIAGLQDELKNILRQLDDQTGRVYHPDLCGQSYGTAVEAKGYQDVDQDMSDSFASNLEPVNMTLQVVIKSENEPDLITQVAVVKSEDGKFDVWDKFGTLSTLVSDLRLSSKSGSTSDFGAFDQQRELGVLIYSKSSLAITSGSWWKLPNLVEQLARSDKYPVRISTLDST
ncbi:hypothetical protein EDD22DRAFT_843154 [Suillus occidentalis]|nr:hypothetical protein EDD22DRAFT_843154 [Suillus occidentalis]